MRAGGPRSEVCCLRVVEGLVGAPELSRGDGEMPLELAVEDALRAKSRFVHHALDGFVRLGDEQAGRRSCAPQIYVSGKSHSMTRVDQFRHLARQCVEQARELRERKFEIEVRSAHRKQLCKPAIEVIEPALVEARTRIFQVGIPARSTGRSNAVQQKECGRSKGTAPRG